MKILKKTKTYPLHGLRMTTYLTDDESYEVKITEEIDDQGECFNMFADIKCKLKNIFAPELKATPAGIQITFLTIIFKDATNNDVKAVSEALKKSERVIDEIYDFLKEIGYIKYDSLKDYPD